MHPCRKGRNVWWDARPIKDMKVENGKRLWLVPYEGKDDDGEPYPDTWEPTATFPRTCAKSTCATA